MHLSICSRVHCYVQFQEAEYRKRVKFPRAFTHLYHYSYFFYLVWDLQLQVFC